MLIRPLVWQRIVRVLLVLTAALTLGVLVFIIAYILSQGLGVITPEFLTSAPERMGKEGGILPQIVVTGVLALLALVVAMPLGLGTAVYLAEYTRESVITRTIRFAADALAGVPSIIFGLFGFILFVIRLRMGWSIVAGGLTLALMVLPTIVRTSEEAIRSVPGALREVSLSLGATKGQTIWHVVLPNALPGILTGGILAVSRAAGEVAPILFTGVAYYMADLPKRLTDQFMDLGYHVFVLSTQSPNIDQTRPILYATVIVLLALTFALNVTAVLIRARVRKRLRALG
ncbi:MAG: phosphate ABC transporter permease PstA [candidate division WOR-3 bacterium]